MTFSITKQRVVNKSLLEYAKINRDKGCFNDVTITAGSESIPANRLILACHSAYFEKMFKANMREKYERIIKVQAIEGLTLKTLIDYIYSGCIVIDNENVTSFLSGADYLQLDDVKQFCFEFLQASITPNTSLTVLEAASLYKNDDLKNEVQQFINNHLDEVAQTDEFKSYSKAKVFECISTLDQNKAKSTSVYQAIVTWIYHSKEERKLEFPELFKMVNLNSMTLEFLENTVLEEELVESNSICQKLALKAYRRLLSRLKLETSESKLLSVGGLYTPSKVSIVFDHLDERPKSEYPEFASNLKWPSSIKFTDHLYVIGGQVEGSDVSNAWRLNIKNKTSEWEQIASMTEHRSLMGAAAYQDSIVVCGGDDEKFDSTEAYLTESNEWKNLSPMNQGRYGHSLVVCDRFVYALGGRCTTFEFLSSAEKLENLIGDWKYIKPMQTPRCHLAAVCCDGAVYAIGGKSDVDNNTILKTVEKYDSAANQWRYVAKMNFARFFHAASVLRDKIYVVGGSDPYGKVVEKIECYDPKNDSWSIVGKTTDQLCEHALVTA